jgi:signal transduction histidine kinase
MPTRDAAAIVSLLGHELRAPAGIIGGYLTLIERSQDSLTPDQQQAVAGARRAQHRLVEILDDASRLTSAWRAETPATPTRRCA